MLSSRAPIGHVAINTQPMATNQGFKSLVPRTSRLDPKYLYYWLRAKTDYLQSLGNGATFKEVSKATVARVEIPLPALDEQRRIAGMLDHADALRAKRRQVHGELDLLAQSIFHDLFGEPGSTCWETVPLGNVVGRIDNGRSPNCEARPVDGEEWGVLKLGAVTYGIFQESENKAYLADVGSMQSNEVRPGDVLMTRKNTRELVGAVALVDDVRPRLLLPDLVFRLHLDLDRIDRRYFQALMMHPTKRHAVRDLASGSAASMPNISKARLVRLPIELPPLDIQREFAGKVEKIIAQRATTQRSLAADNELFASLQSRAFRGEL